MGDAVFDGVLDQGLEQQGWYQTGFGPLVDIEGETQPGTETNPLDLQETLDERDLLRERYSRAIRQPQARPQELGQQ